MCTLTLAWRVFADAPVVVAANRDELVGRPAEPPAVIEADPRVVAPRDAEAGGTWIGYNEHGLLVAVTNRWTDADLAGDRSRGLLVRDALRHESAEAAARFVEREVEAREFDGFNLVIADRTAALLFEWDGRLGFSRLEPGVHVVVNVGTDDAFDVPDVRPDAARQQAANAREVRAALTPEPGETAEDWLERAADVLADHEYGVCVHEDVDEGTSSDQPDPSGSGGGFGTRSSSLILLGEEGARYRFADGPPCETAYRDVDLEAHL